MIMPTLHNTGLAVSLLSLLALLMVSLARGGRVPSSVLLLVIGGVWSALGGPVPLPSREEMTVWVLAPLLLEGARAVNVPQLLRDQALVITLAGPGTLIASALIALLLCVGLGWPIGTTLPFAALIAATDPVAVIATFRSLGLKGRLLTLVESESLCNDVVAATVLALLPLWLTHGATGAPSAALLVAREIVPALGLGLIGGFGVRGFATVTRAARLASVVQCAGAILLAALAVHFHTSAVLACVIAGLVIAAGEDDLPPPRQDALLLYGHAANALVFLVIGALGLPAIAATPGVALAALGVTLIARAGSVYPLAALFRGGALALKRQEQHVLVAGSLRGALALTLCLPSAAPAHGADAPIALTLAVVALSVLLQGLALLPVLRRMGLTSR
jgi:CPA1 family monovalent cation:H+ antiporter